jgi:hypothetical protein
VSGLPDQAPPPIVVFGIGGSGTRAVAQILSAAGVHIGPRLNKASDSHVIHRFLRKWSDSYLEQSGWVDAFASDASAPLPGPADPRITADLERALVDQRAGIPADDARWGWKHPRSAYLLPVFQQVVPDAHTVQLVRDGRDMAYSGNQNQLAVFGELLLGDLAGRPEPVRSIALWDRVNLAALRLSRRHRPERHLLVRYEDLCAEPRPQIRRLFAHLQFPADEALVDRAAGLVAPSPGSQRWRAADPAELHAVETAGSNALSEFGYARS